MNVELKLERASRPGLFGVVKGVVLPFPEVALKKLHLLKFAPAADIGANKLFAGKLQRKYNTNN